MVYGTVTVRTKPGKRFAGIEKLVELANWITEKYKVETEVLGNMSGKIYENHMVTQYESMGQAEEIWDKMFSDPEYLEWFKQSSDLLVWEGATTDWYMVHE